MVMTVEDGRVQKIRKPWEALEPGNGDVKCMGRCPPRPISVCICMHSTKGTISRDHNVKRANTVHIVDDRHAFLMYE